jgi:hypothetical protein
VATRCDETYEQRIRDWIAERNEDLAYDTQGASFKFHQEHACWGSSDFSRVYSISKEPIHWVSHITLRNQNRDYTEIFRGNLRAFDSTRPLPPLFDLSRPQTPTQTVESSDEEAAPLQEDEDEPFADTTTEALVEQATLQLRSLSVTTPMATPAPRPTEMRINVPESFDGDRQKTKQFLNKVVVYLSMEKFTTPMNEKSAIPLHSWIKGWLNVGQTLGEIHTSMQEP